MTNPLALIEYVVCTFVVCMHQKEAGPTLVWNIQTMSNIQEALGVTHVTRVSQK